MNSVKSQDINLLVVVSESGPSKRQDTIVKILKERVENSGGTLKIVYDRLSDKISGENFTEVYYDEISSVVHR